MSTELTAQQEQLDKLQTAVGSTRQSAPRVGTDPYLKMGKDGIWTFGQKNLEVQEGALWAISPFSYRSGYTCWTDYPDELKKKNVNLGKVTVQLGADPVDVNTLPVHTDVDTGQVWDWTSVVEAEFVCINGEDKGTRVLFQTSSIGGLRAMSEYLDKLDQMIPEGKPVAIVELGSDSYAHKQWGKTYVPVLDVKEWRTLEDVAEPAEPKAEIEDQEKPKKPSGRRRPAADAKAEVDDVADEADGAAPEPTRRRRPAA